ncbi:MAG: SDR family oxidoreductase [Ignavibacteria bacterium]|nr:SDR family oxidoreductase [Ignavibacteria bacterium]
MNKNIFLTGFPGFIASRLIPKILSQREESKMFLLVQKKFLDTAKSQIEKLETDFPLLKNRLIVVEGDLTFPNLIEDKTSIDLNSISEIFNLAAVYDLRIAKDIAYKINVEGTQNIVNFSKTLPNLEKFHHISTCYVAGWYRGEFSEEDFDKGQSFKNFYEETKFLSEKIIRENKSQIPFVIYRPSIVIGDSKTGETNKFDGPYPVILLINKLPKLSFMTQIGSGVNPINLISVDYVVDGIANLSTLNELYKTYHLCDPEPLNQLELINLFAKKLNKKLITIKVKYSFARSLMKNKLIADFTGLYPEMIDYFDHDLFFKCEKTLKSLEPFGIHPPKLVNYIDKIIEFAIRYEREISRKGLW